MPVPFSPPTGQPVLDLDGACEFLELSRTEIMALVPEAMREIAAQFDTARHTLSSFAYSDLGRAAHTIKSVAASIGAQETVEIALALERAAMKGDNTACPELFSVLETAVERLAGSIAELG